jgi:ribosome assembly protein RRB1
MTDFWTMLSTIHTQYIMPKRTSDIADLEVGASKSQATGQETARPQEVDEGMGEFEDRFEDDIESEEEIEEIERDAGEDEDDDGVGK